MHMDRAHVFQIACERTAISDFADQFAEWADTAGLDMRVSMAFQVALDEVLTNVVDYAFPDGGGAPIEVRVGLADQQVQVEVIDRGVSFDPLSQAAPDTELALEERDIGGLGIHLVRELMDEVSWRRENDCNLLHLRKRLAPAA